MPEQSTLTYNSIEELYDSVKIKPDSNLSYDYHEHGTRPGLCPKCGFFKMFYVNEERPADSEYGINRHCCVCGNKIEYHLEIEQYAFMHLTNAQRSDLADYLTNYTIDSDLKYKRMEFECNDSNIKTDLSTKRNIQSKVQCPYCKSSNTKKLSFTGKLFSTSLFGLASNSIGKQFVCNNCHAKF